MLQSYTVAQSESNNSNNISENEEIYSAKGPVFSTAVIAGTIGN